MQKKACQKKGDICLLHFGKKYVVATSYNVYTTQHMEKTEFCSCRLLVEIIILEMPQGARRKPKKTFLMIVGTSTENELLFKVGSFCTSTTVHI